MGKQGIKLTEETVRDIVSSYRTGEATVNELCAKYSLSRSGVYGVLWRNGVRGTNSMTYRKVVRKGLRLNRAEVDVLLLIILECEGMLKKRYPKDFIVAKLLQERLLAVADEIDEIESVRKMED